MNNNDILTRLHNDSQHCQPSDNLSPDAIEDVLSSVKRKNYKAIAGTCITLGIACITCIGILSSNLAGKIADPDIIKNANSYADIYKKVNTIKKNNEKSDHMLFNGTDFGIAENAVDNITLESTTGSSSSSDYSNTNIQVEGVDEADIIKTDGEYIYTVNNNKISIILANNGIPKAISEITPESAPSDIYIHNNTLVVMSRAYNINDEQNDNQASDTEQLYGNYFGNSDTAVYVYDISDKNNPVKSSTLSQSGKYISSRRVNDVVYLVTSYKIYNYENIDEDKPETYCPLYRFGDNKKCIDSDSISICNNADSISYITISSIDLGNADNFADICSILGAGEDIYASQKNIYTTAHRYSKDSNKTDIMRFSLDGTKINQTGNFTVDGSILNQFSMDEYNGYFRIVTETTKQTVTDNYAFIDSSSKKTALYVYDKDLKLCGKTDDVAKGESVKSVRFDGDIAYFVTFRQTDPLFTVDLSNPKSPKILSELKIPGFSEYLHIFSDNLLLGFGREADITTGGAEGLKLTMFDISDKTDVTEIATKIFTSSDVYSPAEYNHKAIFIDKEKSRIGIPYTIYTNDGEQNYYSIFEYDAKNNEFKEINKLKLSPNDYSEYFDNSYSRGLYIGDYFYIVTEDIIYAYNYDNFEPTGKLAIQSK